MLSYNSKDVIFDIETEGSTTLGFIQEINPPYPQFVPDAVKVGNLKTEVEREAKIELARQLHADQEAEHWASKLDKAALTPETGRVVTIGYLRADAPDDSAVLDDADFDEERLLRRFWSSYKRVRSERGRFVGWNSNGFDLPYLIKRSWMLQVPVPTDIYRGKWLTDTWLDLMLSWSNYAFREWTKLDVAARILGLGNKTDQACSGKAFAEWYRDPARHEQAVHYGKLDLTLTRAIYLRMCSTSLNAAVPVS